MWAGWGAVIVSKGCAWAHPFGRLRLRLTAPTRLPIWIVGNFTNAAPSPSSSAADVMLRAVTASPNRPYALHGSRANATPPVLCHLRL